jgi:hypothetical protein
MTPTRIRSAGLAALAFATLGLPLGAADTDPSTPEGAVLPAVKALHDNDFKALFALMPAEDQAKAQDGWKQSQTNPDPKSDAQFDQMLGQLLDPKAVDNLAAQAEPQLKTMDLTKTSQGIMAMSGLLPMLAAQNGKQLTPDDQKGLAMVQNLLNDVAAWIPKSGINDDKKLRDALEHVVAGAKALGVKDSKELHALAFDDLLTRVGPMLKELKSALAVYDLQADKLLESVKATSAGDGDQRTLTVSFTAFGRPYETPVKVQKVNGKWVMANGAPAGLDAFKGMLPGLPGAAPAGGGQGEGAGEVR